MTNLEQVAMAIGRVVTRGEVEPRKGWLKAASAAVEAMWERVGEWQPIETTPPGRNVLVYDPRWGVAEAMHFANGDWGLATFNGSVKKANPTHWMPLPEPPL